ncbi:putative nuclease HARBI1 [Eupeodes corollae]|uniref:putative nuclease HARBI1 n=1 Tax=Eupeodes corollae TaxID=290404 RepID=UPI00248F7E4E|nr:putative nuclease HARBI1 [Eupeodes corollae]
MAQSTFSKNLKIVLNILERRLCPVWIKLETTEVEKRQAKLDFYSKAGFPGTIMCLDGTHVKIIAPAEEKFLYFNRKGYFSINAMVICDNKMRVKFIDARYPGSNHDSHVCNLSLAKTHFERKFREGERNTWIIGDAGYPLEPWLITPFRSPEPGSSQSTFNLKHSKTRNMVERVIGVIKNRSRCLLAARQMHYSPQKASQIINLACALHNICIHFKVEDDFAGIEVEPEDEVEGNDVVPDTNNHSVASRIRDSILRSLI